MRIFGKIQTPPTPKNVTAGAPALILCTSAAAALLLAAVLGGAI